MKKAKSKRTRSKGAHGLRSELMALGYHLEGALDALERATKRAREAGAVDQLAVATKALRAIANTSTTDARSKGVAKAALEKMEIGT